MANLDSKLLNKASEQAISILELLKKEREKYLEEKAKRFSLYEEA